MGQAAKTHSHWAVEGPAGAPETETVLVSTEVHNLSGSCWTKLLFVAKVSLFFLHLPLCFIVFLFRLFVFHKPGYTKWLVNFLPKNPWDHFSVHLAGELWELHVESAAASGKVSFFQKRFVELNSVINHISTAPLLMWVYRLILMICVTLVPASQLHCIHMHSVWAWIEACWYFTIFRYLPLRKTMQSKSSLYNKFTTKCYYRQF